MFSRMFAEPVFDIKYMDKEIDAVNSEHEKNINNDGWRKRQLLRSLSNVKHPNNKFATGSKETLRNATSKELNKKLKKFYLNNYKSYNMKLAIICKYIFNH